MNLNYKLISNLRIHCLGFLSQWHYQWTQNWRAQFSWIRTAAPQCTNDEQKSKIMTKRTYVKTKHPNETHCISFAVVYSFDLSLSVWDEDLRDMCVITICVREDFCVCCVFPQNTNLIARGRCKLICFIFFCLY